jgi:hypothetical protein
MLLHSHINETRLPTPLASGGTDNFPVRSNTKPRYMRPSRSRSPGETEGRVVLSTRRMCSGVISCFFDWVEDVEASIATAPGCLDTQDRIRCKRRCNAAFSAFETNVLLAGPPTIANVTGISSRLAKLFLVPAVGFAATESWITSRCALYTNACMSAPEKPSVIFAISSRSTDGETATLRAMACKICPSARVIVQIRGIYG